MRYICDDPEHVKIETDGTMVCQHCYSAAKAKIGKLREALQEIIYRNEGEPPEKMTSPSKLIAQKALKGE